MKYGDISLVLCISTRLRLVTILSLLVKYLVIFHADPCNKSYIYIARLIIEDPREWLASLADYRTTFKQLALIPTLSRNLILVLVDNRFNADSYHVYFMQDSNTSTRQ